MQGYLSTRPARAPAVCAPSRNTKSFWKKAGCSRPSPKLTFRSSRFLKAGGATALTRRITLSLSPTLCAMLLRPAAARALRTASRTASLSWRKRKFTARTGTAPSANSRGCIITNFPSRAKRGATTKAISSARSNSFRTKAASKSSRPARRTGCCRCSPIIRRPSARKF